MSDAGRRLSLLRRDLHALVEELNKDAAHWDCAEKVRAVLGRDQQRISGRASIAWTSEATR